MLHFPICVIFTQEQEKDYEKGENVGYFFYNITYCKTVNQIVQGDCQKVTIEGLLFFCIFNAFHWKANAFTEYLYQFNYLQNKIIHIST